MATAAAASEQQFLEQTPWANPNHPIHKLGRQTTNHSPLLPPEISTPAANSKITDFTPVTQASTSASTIPEYPSAQHSSIFDTPRDTSVLHHSTQKLEHPPDHMNNNGNGNSNSNSNSTIPLPTRSESISPTTTRRAIDSLLNAHHEQQQQQQQTKPNNTTATKDHYPPNHTNLNENNNTNPPSFPQFSSPLQARAALLGDLNRTASVQPSSHTGHDGVRVGARSPFLQSQGRNQGQTQGKGVSGPGMGRFGFK